MRGGERVTRRPTNGAAGPAVPPPQGLELSVLLHALEAMRNGDFSARLPQEWTGLEGKIADRFNEIVSANEELASELARVRQGVGREGKIRQRMRFARTRGAWGEM